MLVYDNISQNYLPIEEKHTKELPRKGKYSFFVGFLLSTKCALYVVTRSKAEPDRQVK
jgi:hypothetical protein